MLLLLLRFDFPRPGYAFHGPAFRVFIWSVRFLDEFSLLQHWITFLPISKQTTLFWSSSDVHNVQKTLKWRPNNVFSFRFRSHWYINSDRASILIGYYTTLANFGYHQLRVINTTGETQTNSVIHPCIERSARDLSTLNFLFHAHILREGKNTTNILNTHT